MVYEDDWSWLRLTGNEKKNVKKGSIRLILVEQMYAKIHTILKKLIEVTLDSPRLTEFNWDWLRLTEIDRGWLRFADFSKG